MFEVILAVCLGGVGVLLYRCFLDGVGMFFRCFCVFFCVCVCV